MENQLKKDETAIAKRFIAHIVILFPWIIMV